MVMVSARWRWQLALVLLVSWAHGKRALENGLARTPPMGWLAWERYVCELDCAKYPGECIDQRLFAEMGQRLVEDGYLELGYQYVNIDDCWSRRQRELETGLLLPDPSRFPDGIRSLADQLHAKGLKLGIYGDCGTYTCQRFPGQLNRSDSLQGNYFQVDADTFAHWQIDSFKFDGCFLNVSLAAQICPQMGLALNATQRPMLFSCSWPAYENDEHLATNWSLVAERCNLWRAFGDIEDSWTSVLSTVDYFVRQQELVVRWHGPGHWFDADQLVVGDYGLSHDQEQAHMAIWCLWASPLYMSNDLRNISLESQQILRNRWAIGVNQDPMGIFGLMVDERSQLQVFLKPMEPIVGGCPSYALIYFDRRTLGNARLVSFKIQPLLAKLHEKLAPVGWSQWASCAHRPNVTYDVHDLFQDNRKLEKQLELANGQLELRVNLGGVRFVKLVEEAQ